MPSEFWWPKDVKPLHGIVVSYGFGSRKIAATHLLPLISAALEMWQSKQPPSTRLDNGLCCSPSFPQTQQNITKAYYITYFAICFRHELYRLSIYLPCLPSTATPVMWDKTSSLHAPAANYPARDVWRKHRAPVLLRRLRHGVAKAHRQIGRGREASNAALALLLPLA